MMNSNPSSTPEASEPQTGGGSDEVTRYASGWRKEPPDRPGWWWRLAEGGTRSVLLRFAHVDGALRLDMLEDNLTKATEYINGWWAGPVVSPPLPDDSHNARSAGSADSTQAPK